MVRLTADLVRYAPQTLNTLKERELDLRGNKIPAVENLAVTMDGFDNLDLSDNEIRRLDNFPRMQRLSTLFVNNNHLVRIGADIGEIFPNIYILMFTGNKFQNLYEIDPLGAMKKLTMLSLIGNPVVRQPHYRLYVIFKIPSLKSLDFKRVSKTERGEAQTMFADRAMPTAADRQAASAVPSRVVERTQKLTAEQQTLIKQAISKAQTNEDVDRLERMLLQGVTPEQLEALKSAAAAKPAPAPAPAAMEVEEPTPAPVPAPAPVAPPQEVPAPAPAPPAPAPAPAPKESSEPVPAPAPTEAVEDTPMAVEEETKQPFNWSKLKVVDLKKEISKRGLDSKGKKADLVARLTADDPYKEK